MNAVRTQRVAGSEVTTIGEGDPLLIVHGGPGLDHSYLVRWLSPLAMSRQLVFYDQLACGLDHTPLATISSSALVDQFVSVVRALSSEGGHLSLLTHSWGSFLFCEATRTVGKLGLSAAVLCSPVGLTRARFDESGERLMQRIPPTVVRSIEQREAALDGVGVMRAALPYYCDRTRVVPEVAFGYYDPAVYNKVIESLGNYDCRDVGPDLPDRTILIYGDADIEIREATREIHQWATVEVIPCSGHFSFAEQPEVFVSTVGNFLNRSA